MTQYLTTEFYSMNYSLGQRLEILEVMTAAAELLEWHHSLIWPVMAFWICGGVTVRYVFMCLVSQVLALAAQELSKPLTQKKAPLPAVGVSTDLSPCGGGDLPVDWRLEVERRIRSKTRRLTKVVTAIRNMWLFSFCTLDLQSAYW